MLPALALALALPLLLALQLALDKQWTGVLLTCRRRQALPLLPVGRRRARATRVVVRRVGWQAGRLAGWWS
jgi:hypothetical protein